MEVKGVWLGEVMRKKCHTLWAEAFCLLDGGTSNERNSQLGARTETQKAGLFTNKKVQAVGRSPAALPLARSRGLRANFFVKKKGPNFPSNPLSAALPPPVFGALRRTAIQLGISG